MDCFKAIISLGMAPIFNQIAMMVVQIVMNNVLRYYGGQSHYGSEIPLACAGIISKVNMIFFSLVIGLSQGLQPIVSFNYGAGKYRRVRSAYLKAVCIATCISSVSFLCFQLIPRQIISIFGSGSEEYFRFNVGRNGTKVVKCQMDCFKAGQIDDYHDTGYNLADNGCQSSTGHSHMKSKDKQRV